MKRNPIFSIKLGQRLPKSFSQLHVKNSRFFLSYILKKDDWPKAYAGPKLLNLPYISWGEGMVNFDQEIIFSFLLNVPHTAPDWFKKNQAKIFFPVKKNCFIKEFFFAFFLIPTSK